MLDPQLIDDHAPLIALLAEQLEVEASALQSAPDAADRLLPLGGITTLVRLLTEEAARLTRSLRLPPPSPAASEPCSPETAPARG